MTQILTFQRYVKDYIVSVSFVLKKYMYKIIFLFVKIIPMPFPLSKTKQKICLTTQKDGKFYIVYITFIIKKYTNKIIFCLLK